MSRTNSTPPEESFNVRIPAALKAAFEAATLASHRPAAQVIGDFMRSFVEEQQHAEAGYDAWFRAAVQAALDDPDPGIPHDEVMAEMKSRLDTRNAAAAKRADHMA